MRKRAILFLLLSLTLCLLLCFAACDNAVGTQESPKGQEDATVSDEDISGNQSGQQNQNQENGQTNQNQGSGSSNEDTPDYEYALFIGGQEDYLPFTDGSLTVTLAADDSVSVKDAEGNTLNFAEQFSPQVDGEYTFTINASSLVEVTAPELPRVPDEAYYLSVNDAKTAFASDGEIYALKLTLSQNSKVIVMNEKDENIFETTLTEDNNYLFTAKDGQVTCNPTTFGSQGKVTVYYTNSLGWSGDIYAYCWNDSTKANNAAWPGEKCTFVKINEYSQNVYSYTADADKYDRIIFNNNTNDSGKTIDMTLNAATSGYYGFPVDPGKGQSGTFIQDQSDYGEVTYYELTDSENLSYRGGSKEIAVYVPQNYDSQKKYGLLVMFDAQNLFAAAKKAKITPEYHGAWSVDVAITALCKNKSIDGCIILGVDNGDSYRDSELTQDYTKFGTLDSRLSDQSGFYNGHLDDLGNFILQTAIPYVKERYSIDTSAGSMGICGSSSGGLAAYYLGLRDLGTFGYIGAFSPAIGLFVEEAWKDFYQNKDFDEQSLLPEIYFYCGSLDDDLEDLLLPATQSAAQLLAQYGFHSRYIKTYYTKYSDHSERWWCIAFSDFISSYLG